MRSTSRSTPTTSGFRTSPCRRPTLPARISFRSGATSWPAGICRPEILIAIGHYCAPQAGAFPVQLRRFRRHLQDTYGSLDALNAAMGTDFDAWYTVFVQPPAYLFPYARPDATPLAAEFDAFKLTALPWCRVVLSPEGFFRKLYLKPRHSRDIAAYNAAHGTACASYAEVPLPRTFPSNAPPLVQAEWRDFTRNTLSPLWLRDGLLDTPETRWRDWLGKRSEIRGQKSEDNSAILNSESWFLNTSPPMPQFAHHAGLFREHKAAIRRELLTRNFRTVLDYLLFHGRGILNTAIYCTLAVLLALVVNPLAAYALSRFKPSAGPQILLFLMLTMAFPHMVTQIPVFILLRELGLLNTFAALLLPGMASGYSIFLLKGFFDSLPRDLYESAQLDGAGEWTLFWHLTMRLSTPILSVIALQAFSVAYANFMYALLICQDPKMWTLMVWLYQPPAALRPRRRPGLPADRCAAPPRPSSRLPARPAARHRRPRREITPEFVSVIIISETNPGGPDSRPSSPGGQGKASRGSGPGLSYRWIKTDYSTRSIRLRTALLSSPPEAGSAAGAESPPPLEEDFCPPRLPPRSPRSRRRPRPRRRSPRVPAIAAVAARQPAPAGTPCGTLLPMTVMPARGAAFQR